MPVVPVLRLRSADVREHLTEVPVRPQEFAPAPYFIRRLQFDRHGLVEVLVNHDVDGILVEHREWVLRSRANFALAQHSMCPGSLVGAFVDGRVVPC